MTTVINPTEVCRRAFALLGEKSYDDAIKLLTNCLTKVEDDVAIGLFHSVLGVVHRVKGDFNSAFQHYGRAEKLIPNDPAIKLIMARLLIDHFAEYDAAIRKVKKLLKAVEHNAVMTHQVYITMGLAYVKKGEKSKAAEMLTRSMAGDFQTFVTTDNIDFHLVEALIRKGWEIHLCYTFLKKAHVFAAARQEIKWIELIQKMLDQFPAEVRT